MNLRVQHDPDRDKDYGILETVPIDDTLLTPYNKPSHNKQRSRDCCGI